MALNKAVRSIAVVGTGVIGASWSAQYLARENGPERPDFKIKLYADMDAVTPADSLIASSSRTARTKCSSGSCICVLSTREA